MKLKNYVFFILVLFCFLTSCATNKNTNENRNEISEFIPETGENDAEPVQARPLVHEPTVDYTFEINPEPVSEPEPLSEPEPVLLVEEDANVELVFQEHAGFTRPLAASDRNTNVLGPGSLNIEGVFEYIKIRNRNPVSGDEGTRWLLDVYFTEAVAEDVNHDLAVAQMLYWTAFLSNEERVNSNNFGGLNPTREWDGKFSNMTEGVRAHIQHLRGYGADALKDANTVNVDPRWAEIAHLRGRVATFEQVYRNWTAHVDRYRRNLNVILENLYRHSDNQ